jgi:hypothetical protein
MSNKEQIIEKALEILGGAPEGVRYSSLVQRVHEALPNIPKNTVHGTIWKLDVTMPDKFFKPARGLWMHVKFREGLQPEKCVPVDSPKEKIAEKQFYEPFANWLVNELEECTKAIQVGGNSFKDKWGTPDVIGIREPRKSDIIKFPTEIVSAEIKLDSASLITAFGQACAYWLFSHKSYLVVPATSLGDDLARLDALARIFGIGPILFNATDPKSPNFDIRVRAAKHEPDMFYVNRSMKLIEDELFG